MSIFFGRVFRRIPKKTYLAVVAFLFFFSCIALAFTTDTMWKNKYWVSVDAVVTDSKVEITEKNGALADAVYYDETYQITYTFDYDGEIYQTIRSSSNDVAIGTIENIKVNPNNPENSGPFVCMLPAIILAVGGGLIILKFLMHIFRKR